MEYLTLKNSELNVSRICLGGCPMGQYGWGLVNENELIDAVNTAVDSGINFFDTADTYGLGKSEETLAKALGARRRDVIVATKFGVRAGNGRTFYDNSPQWIETALSASLKRLNTDYIDLYQIHYRDNVTPIETVLETLEKLRDKGYIRYFGLSNLNIDDYNTLKGCIGNFVSIQEEYSLACRKNEESLIYFADKLNLTPMTWGSLGQGVLTGKYDRSSSFGNDDRRSRDIYVNFHGDKLDNNLEIVELLKETAQRHSVSAASAALRFILDYINNSVVLVGAKRSAQVLDNIRATGWKLGAEEIEELCRISG